MLTTSNANSRDIWDEEEDDDTVAALMAATSHYGDKSEDFTSSFGTCHAIPAPYGPTLPSSGDYTAYVQWSKGITNQAWNLELILYLATNLLLS